MKNAALFRVLILMIVAAALMRVMPHPWNFTPVGAMALFAGATFQRRGYAFLVPISAMFLGDVLLEITTGFGIHSGMPIIYSCFCLSVVLGMSLRGKRWSVGSIGALGAASATLFFLVTNFWNWTMSLMYAKTLPGLISCYIAGLPYYANDLAGHWTYSAILFGTFAWALRRSPEFQAEKTA